MKVKKKLKLPHNKLYKIYINKYSMFLFFHIFNDFFRSLEQIDRFYYKYLYF